MALHIDQLEVTSFEVSSGFDLSPNEPYTPPIPNCYSPLCIPTEVKDQCPPDTQTANG